MMVIHRALASLRNLSKPGMLLYSFSWNSEDTVFSSLRAGGNRDADRGRGRAYASDRVVKLDSTLVLSL